jgi:hypothetical protein
MSTCFDIKGTNRISRAAVSGTEYLRHAPSRKKNDFRSIECQAFVRSKLDAKILGQGRPAAVAIELCHPVDIGNVGRESVA